MKPAYPRRTVDPAAHRTDPATHRVAHGVACADPALHCTDPAITRVLAGDPRAERALYDRHVDRVHSLIWRMTGDEELAREYTQQTFIRAFRRLDTFRGNSSLATWLHRVAVNVTLSGLRRVRRALEVEQALAAASPEPAVPCVSERLLRQHVRDAVDALPELYRTVVVMHDLEGFTHTEIGAILNIPSGTSKARLSRARAQLRPLLEAYAPEYATA